jgi:hypothetical protein
VLRHLGHGERIGRPQARKYAEPSRSASNPGWLGHMWRDKAVLQSGEGIKQLRHPRAGLLALEYSTFIVDGRPDLALLVYNPANDDVAKRIKKLIDEQAMPDRKQPRA